MHIYISNICIDVHVFMHMYVSLPLKGDRTFLPLCKEGWIMTLYPFCRWGHRHQRCSSSLRADCSSESAGKTTSGHVLKAGCRSTGICWRAQLSSNMVTQLTDWTILWHWAWVEQLYIHTPIWISLGCYNVKGLTYHPVVIASKPYLLSKWWKGAKLSCLVRK